MASTVGKDSDITFEDMITDILPYDNIMFSVRSNGAVCEVNSEKNIRTIVQKHLSKKDFGDTNKYMQNMVRNKI